MWKLIDQFIVIPFCIFALLFGIAWLGQHPLVLCLTIAALPIVYLILLLREIRNPNLAKKYQPPKFTVKEKVDLSVEKFIELYNHQNKK